MPTTKVNNWNDMTSRNRSLVLRGTFKQMDAGGAVIVMDADSGDSGSTTGAARSTATAGTTGLQQVAGAAEVYINPRLKQGTHRQAGEKRSEHN